MSDDVPLLHHNALMLRLQTDPELAAFDDEVPGDVTQYVRVWSTGGIPDGDERGDGSRQRRTTTHTLTCVGLNQLEALWVHGRVGRLLDNWLPQLEGRSTWRLAHEVSRPTDWDTTTTPPTAFTRDQYDLSSTPTRSTSNG